MASRRPKRKMISGVEYKIVYLDPYDLKLNELDGLCDLATKTIYISKIPSVEHYTIDHILEHECIHALLYERGIRDLDSRFEHCIIEAVVDYILES